MSNSRFNRRHLEFLKVSSPILEAIRNSGVAKKFAGQPVTSEMLAEIGEILTKATRLRCIAFHEIFLVPASVGMVRVHIAYSSGQKWTVVAIPGGKSA